MRRIKILYLLPPVIFITLIGVMLWGILRKDPDQLPSQMIGKPAPAVNLEPLADYPLFTTIDLQRREIKVVNFWASWCAPCRAEHPNITAISQLGIPVYGINYKDTTDQAVRFLNALGNPYSKIGTDTGRTALNWGLYGVPETIIIDENGIVLLREPGPVTSRILNTKILPLLVK